MAESSAQPEAAGQEGGELAGPFELLAEMTQDFADSLDIEETLSRALARIAGHLGAEAGSLWLLEDGGEQLVCRACVGPTSIRGLRLAVSEGILGRSVRENRCQRAGDVTREPDFTGAVDERTGFATRSLLCAPMSVKDRPLGAIELINKKAGDGHFGDGDAQLLQTLASSAALAFANARLTESLVEHERVRRELELAAEIQRGLLPAPRPAPFPVYGANVPARTVSGDFFDIIPLGDGRIAFALGDVSGKGMNAALMMAKTASLYRCLVKSIDRPGQLLAVLNDEICETASRGMFVTMVAGSFDPASGTACLANAGHEPPLCRSAGGEFTALPAEAPPLGISPDVVADGSYPEADVSLRGRHLYIFSDGLTEACAPDGGQLGTRGVQSLISRFADRPLAERVQQIVASVGALDHRDDLTLLVVAPEDAAH